MVEERERRRHQSCDSLACRRPSGRPRGRVAAAATGGGRSGLLGGAWRAANRMRVERCPPGEFVGDRPRRVRPCRGLGRARQPRIAMRVGEGGLRARGAAEGVPRYRLDPIRRRRLFPNRRGSSDWVGVAEPLSLRDEASAPGLVVVRLGAVALGDGHLRRSVAECHARWGFWGFSVLVSTPTPDVFERVRTHFRGPIPNPAYQP